MKRLIFALRCTRDFWRELRHQQRRSTSDIGALNMALHLQAEDLWKAFISYQKTAVFSEEEA